MQYFIYRCVWLQIQKVIFFRYETLGSWDSLLHAGDCGCGSYDSVNSSLFLLALHARGRLFKITRAAWHWISSLFFCPNQSEVIDSTYSLDGDDDPKRPNPSVLHQRRAAAFAAFSPILVNVVHDLRGCCIKPAREAHIANYQRPAWQKRTLYVNSLLCLCLDGGFRGF